MTGVYESLGVRTIINAKGPSTRLSGGLMRPEVAAAIAEASRACVDIAELQAAAGRAIAEATGAEAGLVTSGAAAALLLGTAAALTGLDPARMARLPDTTGFANEVVVARSQRNQYDHAVRAAGARLVEVGLPDRVSGAGVRDAESWEYAAAIGERTAAVLYVAQGEARPALAEVARVAHAARVPVIVDAAAQLPPAVNLRRFIAEGADLVAYSGGKAIGGPQASGILCGRRDLVMAAALQMLDMDVVFAQWSPPPSLIDKARLVGAPPHGIGRPCKAGKEEIVGLVAALRLFLAEGDAARTRRWRGLATDLVAALRGLNGASVSLRDAGVDGSVPMVELALAPDAPMTALALATALQDGEPSIHVDPHRLDAGVVLFGPTCLEPDAPALIGRRVHALFRTA
ncbi:MAG: selenocysteine synthase [Alphaproteobacteria bacterium]|nr:selenocysteine synthase [Alphaproteobacteria bacterium]